MKHLRMIFASAVSMLLAAILPFAVLAAPESDTCAMELHCVCSGVAVSGSEISLYRVAQLDSSGKYAFCGGFTGCPAEIDVSSAEGANILAATLESFAVANAIRADRTTQSDENGVAVFDPLPAGLYLVVFSQTSVGWREYRCDPIIVSLPYYDDENVLVHRAKIIPKWESDSGEGVEISVIKVWDDGDSPSRPDKVRAVLYRDGAEYENIVLSHDNNWRHTWTDLAPGHDYKISEPEVPAGYKLSVLHGGNVFTLKNSAPPPPPGDEPGIPQTGMLLWPIPVFFLLGFTLIILGILTCREKI